MRHRGVSGVQVLSKVVNGFSILGGELPLIVCFWVGHINVAPVLLNVRLGVLRVNTAFIVTGKMCLRLILHRIGTLVVVKPLRRNPSADCFNTRNFLKRLYVSHGPTKLATAPSQIGVLKKGSTKVE